MAPVDSHVLLAANSTRTLKNATTTFTSRILARAALPTVARCSGCLDPNKVNNKAFFALFALLGVACVLTSIWFFFWAKNGGFKFQEGDWEDYKTTVLRRKGPDGKTIYSGSRGTRYSTYNKSDRIAAKSVVGYDEKGRKGVRSQRGFGGSHSIYYSDDFTIFSGSRADDMSEVMTEKNGGNNHARTRGGHQSDTGHSRRYRDRDLREYKQEKPARVGGINRSADGTQYDYSDRSETMTELTDRSTAPLTTSNNHNTEDRKRAKAEKKAAEDAARMERKWRKDAERAAALLARENAAAAPSPKTKKSYVPVKESAPRSSRRRDSRSRSHSPKKSQSKPRRDYSFSGGPDEVSTVYSGTQTASTNQSSYYDAYRPLAQGSPSARAPSSRRESVGPAGKQRRSRYESEASGSERGYEQRRERQKPKGSRDVMAGYRRGRDGFGSDSE